MGYFFTTVIFKVGTEQHIPLVINKMGLINVIKEDGTEEQINNKTVWKKYVILSPIITVTMIFVMVSLVIWCRYFRARRIRRQNQEKGVKTIIERNQDKPPSYTRIFFSEDPPAYKKLQSGQDDKARYDYFDLPFGQEY